MDTPKARKTDYYGILGVPRNAPLTQIKRRYRELASLYHPDHVLSADSQTRFREVAEAYAVLQDPRKRAQYDGSRSASIVENPRRTVEVLWRDVFAKNLKEGQ